MIFLKKFIFFIFLLGFPFLYSSIFSKQKSLIPSDNTNPKVLILIIASDNFPGVDLTFPYLELKKIWRSYMHSNPNNIEAYFIQADPNLSSPYEIQEDIIWSKTEENLKPGILNKTILSIECMLPRLHEFDYVIRTNLSSFYVFPRLLNFLKTLPRSGCYSGYPIAPYHYQGGKLVFGHGCGFIMSSDVAAYLVGHQEELRKTPYFEEFNDDVNIGYFFKKSGIQLIPAPLTWLETPEQWKKYKKNKSDNDFHFRVKHQDHELRSTFDISILQCLLKEFYGLSLPGDNPMKKNIRKG